MKQKPTCNLRPDDLSRREVELRRLFSSCSERRELADGQAFRFPRDEETAARLLRFVHAEGDCCAFLTFELVFEPGRGPIWLRLRGSAEAKAFLEAAPAVLLGGL